MRRISALGSMFLLAASASPAFAFDGAPGTTSFQAEQPAAIVHEGGMEVNFTGQREEGALEFFVRDTSSERAHEQYPVSMLGDYRRTSPGFGIQFRLDF